jgi:exopolysaccharide biosynthesis predicted pyruvyltransferase EpsI
MTLSDLLEAHRDRPWYFVSPGGNWGDHLIYAGADALCQRIGLKRSAFDFNTFDPAALPAGAAIYLHGGGGFNPWGSRRAFSNLQKALTVRDALVVQGPQTCDVQSPETAKLFDQTFAHCAAAEVHIFTRSRLGQKYLAARLRPEIHLHVDKDTALHLGQQDTLALAGLNTLQNGRYTLLVSRADDEMPESTLQPEEGMVCMDPAYFAISFPHWLRIHAFAKEIITNRLHSAIAGSLLGRPVTLLPGSYHKNRSIWELYLHERGVRWQDEFHPAKPGKAVGYWLPKRIRTSWKVSRALMWLQGVPVR